MSARTDDPYAYGGSTGSTGSTKIYKDGNSYGDKGSAAAVSGKSYTPGRPSPTISSTLPRSGSAPSAMNLTATQPIAQTAAQPTVDPTSRGQPEAALPSYADYTSGRTSYENYTKSQLSQSAGTGGAEQFPIEALGAIGSQGPITDQALADDLALDYSDGQADPAEAEIDALRAQTGGARAPLISGLRSFQDFFQF